MHTGKATSLSIKAQLSEIAEMVTAQNDRLRQLENALTICQQRVVFLAGREPNYLDPNGSYMSALTYCETKTDGVSFISYVGPAYALDKLALDMCRKMGIRIGREPNAMWGWSNLYPLEILHECYMAMQQGNDHRVEKDGQAFLEESETSELFQSDVPYDGQERPTSGRQNEQDLHQE
ncbi:MAG: hypothetical protein HQM04_10730 [Magnetococcales bacterium]|nr:hypothetical protein [Magnetococcales bacterium]MBF0115499.1 hypothetical protein [Magnetococcales bacterium]